MHPCSGYQHCISVTAFDVLDDLAQHAILPLKGLNPLLQLGKLGILIMDFLLNGTDIRLLAFSCLLS